MEENASGPTSETGGAPAPNPDSLAPAPADESPELAEKTAVPTTVAGEGQLEVAETAPTVVQNADVIVSTELEPGPAAETPAELAPAAEATTARADEAAPSAEAESLDDIKPTPPAPAATEVPVTPARVTVPWWPFLVYLGLWIVLVGVAVWKFLQVPAGQPVYNSSVYGIALLGGLLMTAAGVLLILAVWLATALSRGATRRGLMFVDSFVRGALVTFVGVLIWWIALVVVDYLRLGRPF